MDKTIATNGPPDVLTDSPTHPARHTDSRTQIQKAKHMKQEMLINVSQPEECRIAIVEDGVLEELYIERTSQDNYVGNIYKGKVVNHRAEHPGGVRRFRRRPQRLLAHQRCRAAIFPPRRLRPGQADRETAARRPPDDEAEDDPEVDDAGRAVRAAATRARRSPALQAADPRNPPPRRRSCSSKSSRKGSAPKGRRFRHISASPGRYLVLMPALGRMGVSRKIENDEARRRLRDMILELNPPKGVGFIVRTAGIDRTKKEISRDLAYLVAPLESDHPPDQEVSRADGYL